MHLIFCFGDQEFVEKLTRRKAYFKCPVVFVGNRAKLEHNKKMKPLMDYYLDVPIYGSKIFNIIAQAKSIEEKHNPMNDEEEQKRYNGKILVAEDNINNQLLIKLILEEIGLNVVIVENGQLAVDKYKEEEFDLVFLDINMPVMDGLGALKHIRAYESEVGKRTPLVALTANSIIGDSDKYLKEGMDHYLSKPINNKALAKVLELHLNKEDETVVEINTDNIITKVSTDSLDINKISEKLGVGENIAQMVINKFRANIVNDLNEMNDILKNEDQEEIFQKAHYLKNSCLNVALEDVCNLLMQLEDRELSIAEKSKIFKRIEENITNNII